MTRKGFLVFLRARTLESRRYPRRTASELNIGVEASLGAERNQAANVISPVFKHKTPFSSRFPSQDGHPEVESQCRALVKYIEEVLGESIESYLV